MEFTILFKGVSLFSPKYVVHNKISLTANKNPAPVNIIKGTTAKLFNTVRDKAVHGVENSKNP